MSRRKTHEEFVAEVYNLVGNEYEVLGVYMKANNKILMKHNECNCEWYITPSHFINGKRCPNCNNKNKTIRQTKTNEQFTAEIRDLVGDEYSALEKYKNAKTKILMRHNTCGNEYYVTPNAFLDKGRRCPKCMLIKNGLNRRKSTEEFKKEVFDLTGDEYTLLSDYILMNKKVKIIHNNCGYEYEVKPNNFMNGQRCPQCYGNIKKTTEQFKQEVFELAMDEYEVLGEYINRNTKILMKHNKCGNEYKVRPSTFIRGQRCPICNESKGEQTIRHWLESHDIDFEAQKEFDGLIGTGGRQLSYDFYLPDYNLLIEYQGQFHDGSNGKYTKLNLEKQQEHDKRKKEYAQNHNIKLLEIWYWDYENIEIILENKLIR